MELFSLWGSKRLPIPLAYQERRDEQNQAGVTATRVAGQNVPSAQLASPGHEKPPTRQLRPADGR